MVNYNQKDVRVKLNDADLFCDSVDIKYDASLRPNYNTLHGKSSHSFVATAPPKGTVNVSYLLTGDDSLVDRMYNELEPVSIDFNGLSVGSGYLTSYSFNAEGFDSIKVSASFDFYQDIAGVFAASSSSLSDVSPLNISDLSLEGGEIATKDKVKSINYGYKVTLSPNFVISNDNGYEFLGVVSSEKRVDASFSLFDYDLDLPFTGIYETFKLNLKDKNGVSKQEFYVDGQLVNKTIAGRVGDRVTSNYSISQARLGASINPSISFLDPAQGNTEASLTLYGANFSKARGVLLGEFDCPITDIGTSAGYETLTVDIPEDILSDYYGNVSIRTEAGIFPFSGPPFHVLNGLSNF